MIFIGCSCMKNILFILTSIIVLNTFPIYGKCDHKMDDGSILKTEDETGKTGIGSWVKHGKVVCQSISFHSGKFYTYVYQSPTGNWSLLHDNIVGINDFLREEINTKVLSDKFIEGKDLVGLLFYNMGSTNSTPITHEYMKDIEERYGDHRKPWGDWSDDDLRAKSTRYALPSLTVVKDNQWTLELNLLTESGGMEH